MSCHYHPMILKEYKHYMVSQQYFETKYRKCMFKVNSKNFTLIYQINVFQIDNNYIKGHQRAILVFFIDFKNIHYCSKIDGFNAQKMKFSINNFFSKCDQIHGLLTFTEEIVYGKLCFL